MPFCREPIPTKKLPAFMLHKDTYECWRAVVGFEQKYEISTHGRLRKCQKTGYKYFPTDDTGHYVLFDGGHHTGIRRASSVPAARLVLLHFVSPAPYHGAEPGFHRRIDDFHVLNLFWLPATARAKRRGRKSAHWFDPLAQQLLPFNQDLLYVNPARVRPVRPTINSLTTWRPPEPDDSISLAPTSPPVDNENVSTSQEPGEPE